MSIWLLYFYVVTLNFFFQLFCFVFSSYNASHHVIAVALSGTGASSLKGSNKKRALYEVTKTDEIDDLEKFYMSTLQHPTVLMNYLQTCDRQSLELLIGHPMFFVNKASLRVCSTPCEKPPAALRGMIDIDITPLMFFVILNIQNNSDLMAQKARLLLTGTDTSNTKSKNMLGQRFSNFGSKS